MPRHVFSDDPAVALHGALADSVQSIRGILRVLCCQPTLTLAMLYPLGCLDLDSLDPDPRPNTQSMDPEQWVMDFVRSGGFAEFMEAILARGLFGDSHPEKMVDVQQACMVSALIERSRSVLCMYFVYASEMRQLPFRLSG